KHAVHSPSSQPAEVSRLAALPSDDTRAGNRTASVRRGGQRMVHSDAADVRTRSDVLLSVAHPADPPVGDAGLARSERHRHTPTRGKLPVGEAGDAGGISLASLATVLRVGGLHRASVPGVSVVLANQGSESK